MGSPRYFLSALFSVLTAPAFAQFDHSAGGVDPMAGSAGLGAGGAPGLNAASDAIDKEFQAQLQSAQNDLLGYQRQLANCAVQEQQTLNNAKGDQAEQNANALGQGVGGVAGVGMAVGLNWAMSKASNQKQAADASIASIKNQVESLAPGASPPVAALSGGAVNLDTIAMDTWCKQQARATQNLLIGNCNNDKNRADKSDCNTAAVFNTYLTTLDSSIASSYQDSETCKKNIKDSVASLNTQYQTAITNKQTALNILNNAASGAAQSVASSIGNVFVGHAQFKNAKQNAEASRQQCEQTANDLIRTAQQNITNLKNGRGRAMLSAQLQAQAQSELGKNVDTTPLAQGTINIGGPGSPLTPKQASAAAPGGNSAAPGKGGGGGGGGGGGAGGGNVEWTFGGGGPGGGPGSPVGPLEAGTYEAGGGGGGGGGFGDPFGMFGQPDPFADPNAQRGPAGAFAHSEAGFGDGGLNVLLNRARERMAPHAAELVKSLNLQSLARAPAVSPEGAQRLPASN